MRTKLQVAYEALNIDMLTYKPEPPPSIQKLQQLLDMYIVACLNLPDRYEIIGIAYGNNDMWLLSSSIGDMFTTYVWYNGAWRHANDTPIKFTTATWFDAGKVACINAYLEDHYQQN